MLPETALRHESVALADSYRSLRGGLLRFLRSRVDEAAVAEDLLHEVFVKALAALERGDRPTDLAAWLHRIAANAVIDHYRTRRATAPLPEDLVAEQGDDGMSPEQVLAQCLRPFIEGLPSPYRESLRATALEGRSLRSVAEAEGVSVSAIKSRVSRGRRMLRERLHDCCHIELSAGGRVLDYAPRHRQGRQGAARGPG